MTMSSPTKMPSAKTVLSTAASVAASLMLARTIVHDFLPREVQDFFFSGFRNLINHFSSQQTIVIEEFDELTNNQVYEAAEIYLGNKISPSTQKLVRVSKSDKDKNIKVAMGRNEEIIDTFDGIQFKWRFVCTQVESNVLNHDPRQLNSTFRSEVRSLELNCHKKYKEKVLATYLPHILEQSKSMNEENKTVKLFTVGNMYNSLADMWNSINLDHPATFDTLAMDVELKRMVMEDLERFVQRKEFYRRVGKAWKRGYLLYGPPGTGKSSLIAAMANYLNFDIYDLELTDLRGNSDLRRLLIATANRSILVVEDIDCTVELQDRLAEARAAQPHVVYDEGQVTLSGLLNFTDGLWSSCGDERIIVFTTNHKDRLDHALLRPGRMDMHIHMSYCTPCGFNLLASNYLEINDHPRFREIEELIEKVEVTPAMVAEELMKKGNPEVALEGLLEFLQYKKRENEEAKITEIKEREPDQQESGDCSN